MTREELFKKYEAVKKRLKFFVETEEPWLRALNKDGNDYKGMIVNGRWLPDDIGRAVFVVNISVTLEIIHRDHLPEDWILRNSYRLRNVENMARLPGFLKRGTYNDVSYVVWLNVNGKRILDRHPFSTPDQKKEVAKMYWATVEALKILDRSKLGKESPGYFRKKFMEWVGLRSELKPQWKPSMKEMKKIILRGFGKVARLARGEEDGQNRKIKMEWFFNVFGNTDIVKSQAGEYFIYNAHLGPKPEGFGIAVWVWNVMMYSWEREPQEVLKEVFDWIDVFLEGKDRKECMPGILANLIERCVGALFVDLPGKRSPYDGLNNETIQRSRKNFSYVLDTLVEVKI